MGLLVVAALLLGLEIECAVSQAGIVYLDYPLQNSSVQFLQRSSPVNITSGRVNITLGTTAVEQVSSIQVKLIGADGDGDSGGVFFIYVADVVPLVLFQIARFEWRIKFRSAVTVTDIERIVRSIAYQDRSSCPQVGVKIIQVYLESALGEPLSQHSFALIWTVLRNNTAPKFLDVFNDFRVIRSEFSSPGGELIATVVAEDFDSGPEGQLTYSIDNVTAGNTALWNSSDLFRVDEDSGAISTQVSLDYESVNGYVIAIRVSDGGWPTLSDTGRVTVSIQDENDNAPILLVPDRKLVISSYPAVVSLPITIQVKDSDTSFYKMKEASVILDSEAQFPPPFGICTVDDTVSSCGISPAVNIISASMLHPSAKRFNRNANTLVLNQGGYATVDGSVLDNIGSLGDDLCVSLWFMKSDQDVKYEVLWELASTNTLKPYLQLSTRKNGQRITLSYQKNANRKMQNVHFDFSFTVDDSQWHYLLVCVNYPEVSLNLDDIFRKKTISKPMFDDSPNSNNAEMRLGNSIVGDTHRFVGSIGQAYLMQGANITSDEIQCLMSCGMLLQYSSTAGIVGKLDKWRRRLTLEGNKETSIYEQALRNVEYKAYFAATSFVTIQVNDTDFSSNSESVEIVSPSSAVSRPVLDLNGVDFGLGQVRWYYQHSPVFDVISISNSDDFKPQLTSPGSVVDRIIARLENRVDGVDERIYIDINKVPSMVKINETDAGREFEFTTVQGQTPSLSNFLTAITALRYTNNASSPNTKDPRKIRFDVYHGNIVNFPAAYSLIAVHQSNVKPKLNTDVEHNSLVIFNEGEESVLLAPSVIASDDSASRWTLQVAVIEFASRPDGSSDTLGLDMSLASHLSVFRYNENSQLVIAGPAPTAAFTSILRTVTYSHSADSKPSTSPRNVSIYVTDLFGLQSNVINVTIVVNTTNVAPSIDLSVLHVGTGYASTFVEQLGAIRIVFCLKIEVVLSFITRAVVKLRNPGRDGTAQVLLLPMHDSLTVTYNFSTFELTVTGKGTVWDYQNLLELVEYNNTRDEPDTDVHYVDFYVEDSNGLQSNIATSNISTQLVNDHFPVFDPATPVKIEVAENISNGSMLLQLTARDGDAGMDGVLSYLLGTNSSGPFSVDSRTGAVILSGDLDHEANGRYVLDIIVRDGGSPVRSAEINITVIVTDVNDNCPRFSENPYRFTPSENADLNTTISVTATDSDSSSNISYRITGGNEEGAFVIDSVSGLISTLHQLDRETLSHYVLNVSASDQTNPPCINYTLVIVTVRDENDNAPNFTQRVYAVSVLENATVGQTIVQVKGTDADAAESDNNVIRYSLDTVFNDTFEISPQRGELSLRQALDYETKQLYEFDVTATDRNGSIGGLNGTARVIVRVIDINDNPPEFVGVTTGTIHENLPAGTTVFTFEVRDADSGENGRVSLSIVSGNDNSSFNLSILNTTHAVVSTTRALDYEAQRVHIIVIQAIDNPDGLGVGQQFVSNQNFTLMVLNLNDHPPVISTVANATYVEPFGDITGYVSIQPNLSVSDGDNNDFYLESGSVWLYPAARPRCLGRDGLDICCGHKPPGYFVLAGPLHLNGTQRAHLRLDHLPLGITSKYVDQLTVSAWVKQARTDLGYVVSYADESNVMFSLYARAAYDDFSFRYALANDTRYSRTVTVVFEPQSVDLQDEQWHHYAVIVDFPNINLIVDGIEEVRPSVISYKRPDNGAKFKERSVLLPFRMLNVVDGVLRVGASQHQIGTERLVFSGSVASVMVHETVVSVSVLRCMVVCGQQLRLLPQTDITGLTVTEDNVTGRIDLVGSASAAVYQRVLRNVQYVNLFAEPDQSPATVAFRVHDSSPQGFSDVAKVWINIQLTNDHPPRLDLAIDSPGLNASVITMFEEEATEAAQIVVRPRITDDDKGVNLICELLVRITDGSDVGLEVLTDPVLPIGFWSRFWNSSFTLKVNASDVSIKQNFTAWENVAACDYYRNFANEPSQLKVTNIGFDEPRTRLVSFQVYDCKLWSDPAYAMVQINMKNDPPVIDLDPDHPNGASIDNEVEFTEGQDSVLLSARNAVIEDPDDDHFTCLYINLTNPRDGNGEYLTVRLPKMSTSLSVTGNRSHLISINGTASISDYIYMIKNARYGHSDDERPSTGIREVTFRVKDSKDAWSSTASSFVTFRSLNDPPVLDLNGAAQGLDNRVVFVEDSGSVMIVDSGVSVLDVDSEYMSNASACLRPAVNDSCERLTATESYPIEVIYNASCLQLSGVANTSVYRQVLRTVRYVNCLDEPAFAARWVDFNITDDGGATGDHVQVTIRIELQNDHSPVFDRALYVGNVSESTMVSATILRVHATDADKGFNTSISYSSSPSLPFTVDSESGLISATGLLDYELKMNYTFIVVASDNGASIGYQNNTNTTIVVVYIVDENDNSPVLEPDQQRFYKSVYEDASVGSLVFDLNATDRDSGENARLNYTIDAGNAAEHFEMNVASGEIRVRTMLDREKISMYYLNVSVWDNGVPPRSTKALLIISVLDVNDNTPIFEKMQYTVSIEENLPPGQSVVEVSASDLDTGEHGKISYRIIDGDHLNDFVVNGSSGVISTSVALDRENVSMYNLTIEATDLSNDMTLRFTNTTVVLIEVLDVNDNPPIFPDSPFQFRVLENSMVGTPLTPAFIIATDRDIDNNADVYYSILPSRFSSLIAISNSTGALTVNGSLDREEVVDCCRSSCFNLTVKATDRGTDPRSLSSDKEIAVCLGDVNDNTPVFDFPVYSAMVYENASLGFQVIEVAATDADEGLNAKLDFNIVASNDSDAFTIAGGNQMAGVLLHKLLDYETQTYYQISIKARDSAPPGSQLSGFTIVNISVIDVNDNDPKVRGGPFTVSVPEDAPRDTFVININATDADSGDNGRLTYSIISGNPLGHFRIDAETGIVETAGSLDRESRFNPYMLEIEVRDHGHPSRRTVTFVNVNLLDVNDNRPNFTQSSYYFTVSEGESVMSVVDTVVATDADDGSNAVVTYSMPNTTVPFTVNSQTGAVTVVMSLDRETRASYVFEVVATDGGGLTDNATVYVTVADVNDNAPTADPYEYVASIPEDSSRGTLLRLQSRISWNNSYPTGHYYRQVKLPPDDGTAAVRLCDFLFVNHEGKISLDERTYVGGEHCFDKEQQLVWFQRYDLNVNSSEEVDARIQLSDDTMSDILGKFSLNPTDDTAARYLDINTRFLLQTLDVERRRIRFAAETYTTGINGGLGGEYTCDLRDGTLWRSNYTYNVDDIRNCTQGFTERGLASTLNKERLYAYAGFNGQCLVLYGLTDGIPSSHPAEVDGTTVGGKTFVKYECFPGTKDCDVPDDRAGRCDSSLGRGASVKLANTDILTFDSDEGQNANVSFRISPNNNTGLFVVDTATGALSLNGVLDRERAMRYVVSLDIVDHGVQPLTGTALVVVTVSDVNDNSPEFDRVEYQFDVSENVSTGRTIATITATDADSGLNGHISYYVNSSGNSTLPFDIDAVGNLYTTSTLDYEKVGEYRFRVTARDGGEMSRSSVVNVTVNVVNINDNAPTIDVMPAMSLDFSEGTRRGIVLADVAFVRDADGDYLNATVTILDARDGEFEVLGVNTTDFPSVLTQYNSSQHSLSISSATGLSSSDIGTIIERVWYWNRAPELTPPYIRTVQFVVTDGYYSSVPLSRGDDSVNVTLIPINDAPSLVTISVRLGTIYEDSALSVSASSCVFSILNCTATDDDRETRNFELGIASFFSSSDMGRVRWRSTEYMKFASTLEEVDSGSASGGSFDGAGSGSASGSSFDGAGSGSASGSSFDGAGSGSTLGSGFDGSGSGSASGSSFDGASSGGSVDTKNDVFSVVLTVYPNGQFLFDFTYSVANNIRSVVVRNQTGNLSLELVSNVIGRTSRMTQVWVSVDSKNWWEELLNGNLYVVVKTDVNRLEGRLVENETEWFTLPENQTESSATLLGPMSCLDFEPPDNFNGNATLRFKAWDMTVGTPGDVGVNTTPKRLHGAFSTSEPSHMYVYVVAVNDPPVIRLSGDLASGYRTTYHEDSAAVDIVDFNRFSITDADGDNIYQARVRITGPNGTCSAPGQTEIESDEVVFTAPSFGLRILSVTSTEQLCSQFYIQSSTNNGFPISRWEDYMKSAEFRATRQPKPGDHYRLVYFSVRDASTWSEEAVANVSVVLLRDSRPVVNLGGKTVVEFCEGSLNVSLTSSTFDITDADSDEELYAVTLTLSPPDVFSSLAVTPSGDVEALPYDYTTGKIQLVATTASRTAPLANFVAVLRTLVFVNTADEPNPLDRTLTIIAQEVGLTSLPVTITIEIKLINDHAPILDLDATTTGNGSSVVFTEGGSPVRVTGSDVRITDGDVSVEPTVSYTVVADITNPQDGANEILSADTSSVSTTLTALYNNRLYKLIINGTGTMDDFSEVIATVSYQNTENEPSNRRREIRFVIMEGQLSSDIAYATVDIRLVNDPPVVDLDGTTTNTDYNALFVEDLPAIPISKQAQISDTDDVFLMGVDVTLEIILVRDGNTTVLPVSSDSPFEYLFWNVTVENITSSYSQSTGILKLSGRSQLAAYNRAVDGVRYVNTNPNPSLHPRRVKLEASDGVAVSEPSFTFIAIQGAADPPVVDLNGLSVAGQDARVDFVEDGGAVVLAPNVTVTDVDSKAFVSATLSLRSVSDGRSEQLIVGMYNRSLIVNVSSGHVVSFRSASSSGVSAGVLASAIGDVMYVNNRDEPTGQSRYVDVVVTDAEGSSSLKSVVVINVVHVNDRPELSLCTSSTDGGFRTKFTEGGMAVFIVGTTDSYCQPECATGASPTTTLPTISGSGYETGPTSESASQLGSGSGSNSEDSCSESIVLKDVDSVTLGYLEVAVTSPDRLAVELINGCHLAGSFDVICRRLTSDRQFTNVNQVLYRYRISNGTVEEYRTLLGRIKFQETSDEPSSPSVERVLDVSVSDGLLRSAVRQTRIAIILANDNAPEFSNESYSVSVKEDIPVGTIILQLSVTDRDVGATQLTFGFTTFVRELSINSAGAVFVRASLDRETTPFYNLTVSVSDGEVNVAAGLFISVEDVNDNPPVYTVRSLSVDVPENAVNSTVGVVKATDQDVGESGRIRYYLEGADSLAFTVNSFGRIATRIALDRESASNYSFSVVAVDHGDPALNSSITVFVRVKDEDDNAPLVSVSPSVVVREDAAIGYTVMKVNATDADAPGVNSDVYFFLKNASFNGLSVFTIDNRTGRVTVKERLDRELHALYTVTIKAVNYYSTKQLSSEVTFGVKVSDVNDNQPQFVRPLYNVNISEGTASSTSIVRVSAIDRDAGSNARPRYRLHEPLPAVFSLNRSTGVIALAADQKLDRENKSIYRFVVSVVDSASHLASLTDNSTLVIINVLDINDNSPVFNQSSYTGQIKEGLSYPVSVLTVRASDRDLGTNGDVTFSIVEQSVPFKIDSVSGLVSTDAVLDYEAMQLYSFTVLASDKSPERKSATVRVIVNVLDVNDNSPVFDLIQYQAQLLENSSVMTSVAAVTANDGDGGPMSVIHYNLTGQGSEKFVINSTTGTVYTNGDLDREVQADYRLEVVASDSGDPPRATAVSLIVTVLDVNDNAPVFSENRYFMTVSEAEKNGYIVGAVSATDADIGTNGVVTYSLVSQSTTFDLESSTSGNILLLGQLDFEITPSYVIGISATDGIHSVSVDVNITVIDANDNPPTLQNTSFTFYVQENLVGAYVGQILASDADSGRNALLSFSTNSSEFNIINSTGQLFTAEAADRESKSTFQLVIVVSNIAHPFYSTEALVTVYITDANDNHPLFSESYYNASVYENQAIGTSVITVAAFDSDEGVNAQVSFYLLNNETLFSIDTSSGLVTTKKMLDREAVREYFVHLEATDRGSPRRTGTALLRIVVLDVNDNDPVFVEVPYNFYVLNTDTIPAVVGTVKAVDADEGDSVDLRYFVLPNVRFASVDSMSGNLTLLNSLSNPVEFFVFVTDGGVQPHTVRTTVSVSVLTANANPPRFVGTPYSTTVPENQTVGSSVFTVTALDDDSGRNGDITLTIDTDTDPRGLFLIYQNGTISLRESLDREIQHVHTLLIVARDRGIPFQLSSTANVTIRITDVNDNAPSFVNSVNVTCVDENTANGSIVFLVQAQDGDSGTAGQVTYSLANDFSLFYINARTGEISTVGLIDFETRREYVLIIEATDGASPPRRASFGLVVKVNDLNDNRPLFANSPYAVTTNESVAAGVLLLTVVASDRDAGLNGMLTFSLRGAGADDFDFDNSTGELRTAAGLDCGRICEYNLYVIVTDGGTPPLNSSEPVVVSVIDLNDHSPMFVGLPYNVSIREDTSTLTDLFMVSAVDGDVGLNAEISYNFTTTYSHFVINMVTGEISLSASLDYETTTRYDLELVAADGGNPMLSAVTTVVVNVYDVDDNRPIVTDPTGDTAVFVEGSNGVRVSPYVRLTDSDSLSLYPITKVVATLWSDDGLPYPLSGGHCNHENDELFENALYMCGVSGYGNVIDSVMVQGNATIPTEEEENILCLDGNSESYGRVNHSVVGRQFTVAVWFSQKDRNNGTLIERKENHRWASWRLDLHRDSNYPTVVLWLAGTEYRFAAKHLLLSPDEWHHLTAVVGSNVSVYVDGKLLSVLTRSDDFNGNYSSGYLLVGSNEFRGKMSQMFISRFYLWTKQTIECVVSCGESLFVDVNHHLTNISQTYDFRSRTLTLTALSTLINASSETAFQDAMRSIVFKSSLDEPDTAGRQVSFSASDTVGYGNRIKVSISVDGVNDHRPVLDVNGPLEGIDYVTQFVEDSTVGVAVADSRISLSDDDSGGQKFARIVVNLTNPKDDSQEKLQFVPSYRRIPTDLSLCASSEHEICLSGETGSLQFVDALKAIEYVNNANEPNSEPRIVSFTVYDEGRKFSNSPIAITTINIVAVNDTPVLDFGNNAYVNFTEGDVGVQLIQDARATLSDNDDTVLQGASVHLTMRPDANQEYLSFDDSSVNGIIGRYSTSTGILTLSGAASLSDYLTVLRSVQYHNDHANPGYPDTSMRLITFTVTDGNSISYPVTVRVTFSGVNDAPIIDLNGPLAGNDVNVTFMDRQETCVKIASAQATIVDVDNTELSQLNATLWSFLDGVRVERLAFVVPRGYGDSLASNFDRTTGVLTINGSASVTDYETFLRSIEYCNTALNPVDQNRVVSIAMVDGSGASSSVVTSYVVIVPFNDPPVLNLTGGATFVEGGAAVPFVAAGSVSINDSDSSAFSSVRVVLENPLDTSNEMISLGGNHPTDVTSSSSLQGGEISFTAEFSSPATADRIASLLEAIEYKNAALEPMNTGDRIVVVQIADSGMKFSNNVRISITISLVNDNSPKFALPEVSVSVSENNPSNSYVTQVTATDADSGSDGLLTYSIVSTISHGVDGTTTVGGNNFTVGQSNGRILTASKLDREEYVYHQVLLQARDGGSPSLTGVVTVVVNVTDVNDHSPVFNETVYRATVNGTTGPGELVVTVSALDGDADRMTNGAIAQYLLTAGHTDDQGRAVFSVDAKGRVTTLVSLLTTSSSAYNITVRAADNGATARYGYAMIEVNVNFNAYGPVIRFTPSVSFLSNSLASGVRVAPDLTITDKDGNPQIVAANVSMTSVYGTDPVLCSDDLLCQREKVKHCGALSSTTVDVLEKSSYFGTYFIIDSSKSSCDGQRDNALQLYGEKFPGFGSLNASAIPDLGNRFTVSLLFRQEPGNSGYVFFKGTSGNDRFGIWIRGETNRIYLIYHADGVQRRVRFRTIDFGGLNHLHHMVMVVDYPNVELYFNCSLFQTESMDKPIPSHVDDDLIIGKRIDPDRHFYNGTIEGYFLFPLVLTNDQIKCLCGCTELLLAPTPPSGITTRVIDEGRKLEFSGAASLTVYTNLLSSVRYLNQRLKEGSTMTTVTFQVSDGQHTGSRTSQIRVLNPE